MNEQEAGSPFQVGFEGLTADGVYYPEYKRVSQGKVISWMLAHLPAWERREIQAELCKGAGKESVGNRRVNSNSNLLNGALLREELRLYPQKIKVILCSGK